MLVPPLSQSAEMVDAAKPQMPESPTASAYSDRPLCVRHQGDITVVVYSSPNQEPKHLNHQILPSLHILLVEEGQEIEGLVAILAECLCEAPSTSARHAVSAEAFAANTIE